MRGAETQGRPPKAFSELDVRVNFVINVRRRACLFVGRRVKRGVFVEVEGRSRQKGGADIIVERGSGFGFRIDGRGLVFLCNTNGESLLPPPTE